MDGNRFDAWTRRRFGLATAGALAALLARHHPHDTEAGRRCLRKGRVCANTSKRCCGKLTCDNTIINGADNLFCCKPDDASCKPGASEPGCCSTHCDAETETCKTCRGRQCDAARPCCPLWNCEKGFCGGCADFGQACTAVHPCCTETDGCTNGFCGGCIRAFSPEDGNPPCPQNGALCCDTDCTGGVCVSEQDGPCARDVDCKTCADNFPDQCDGACVAGKCAF